VISITNNAATIQLNGDIQRTIIKKDVLRVSAVSTIVVIKDAFNGLERQIRIPFSSVNVPQSFSSAQALADYISSILGGFDTSSFIENSNGSYVAQVITSPFIIPDTNIENSTGSYAVSLPSADPTPFVLPDITVEVYVDGILQATSSVPTLENNTINILWQ
jgi:hypothetical protein